MLETNKVTYLKDYTPPDYWVTHVNLTFDLRDGETLVSARLQVKKNGSHDHPLVLDGENLELLEVKLNGLAIPKGTNLKEGYVVSQASLSLLPPDESFTVDTLVKIYPEQNTALEGLYKSGGNWCTQCEAEGFRRITFFPDRSDNMATYTTKIIADQIAAPVLLSNGNLVDHGPMDDQRHYAVWEDPFPKPSYLFALVGGDLACIDDTFVTASGRQVALCIYADAKDLDKLDHAMASLKRSMTWDEEVYGREYDLDLFNIVAVDDFNMGAMENKSLNIFNTKYVLAHPSTATDADYEGVEGVIAHEYFHNWTGNRVTCRDWFQLCLKEGLTVFRDQEFSGDMGSQAVNRIANVRNLRMSQFPEDAGPMAHPPRPNQFVTINNFYTATVYSKGAELNRMLQTLLAKESFRKASDLYFERFDGQAVTVEDWVHCMEEASGRDLSQFMLWYTQAGTPTVKANWSYEHAKQLFTLTLEQIVPTIPNQSTGHPRHIPVKFGLVGPDGQDVTQGMLELTQAKQAFTFENIPPDCVPSLFRHFSAPVNLEAPYTDDQLRHLMVHDRDGFNQWEAGNRFLTTKLMAQIDRHERGEDIVVGGDVLDSFRRIVQRTDMDQELMSLALSLPVYQEMAPNRKVIDPQAILRVRKTYLETVGRELHDEFLKIYNTNYDPVKAYDRADAGRRSLQNTALAYLSHSGDADVAKLAVKQYSQANNMTDRYAALTIIINMDEAQSYRDGVTQHFYYQFANDALVVDKWIGAFARSQTDDILQIVKALTGHEAFTHPTPNRMRALYGTFSQANPKGFHAEDGSGYAFVADFLMKLDAKNPQVASRMIGAFEKFRQHRMDLQTHMEAQLFRIAAMERLSPDLSEKLERYLGKETFSQLRAGKGDAQTPSPSPT
ncbi:aminopeptidase N [uncultured Nitrospira sp.]|uniref:aminopeptidase N n=1 Tax=uncultured Nitrospira sp. TaxID=157176 RepID=UPI0031408879